MKCPVIRHLRDTALHLNAGKTKVLAYNTTDAIVHTRDGTLLKTMSDFKYLGAYVDSSEKDLRTRRGLAWLALHKMKKMWTSGLSTGLKRSPFLSTIESVLLYGSETWTLTQRLRNHWTAAIPACCAWLLKYHGRTTCGTSTSMTACRE